MMSRRVIAIFLCIASPLALADGNVKNGFQPNGNYASIGIGYVTSTATIPPCFGTDCYKTQSGPEVSVGLQFGAMPNLVFGASGSSLSSAQKSTTLTSSGSSYSVGLVGGFGPFDAGVSYSSLHSTVKICTNASGVCATTSDTGSDVGALLKLWLGSHFNFGAAIDKFSYSTSIAIYTSTGYFASYLPSPHHAFSVQYNSTVDQNNITTSTGGGVSYSFLF